MDGTLDAAAYIGVSQRTMYKIMDKGLVPAYHQGRVLRIRRSDLDAYWRRCGSSPAT